MTERPLVGVVTPVYNGEPFLRECIESVLAQDYDRWEYTIVDNCSTDRSGEIAREYAARDRRIHVVRNERHLDQVANLNRAMDAAPADCAYVKMVLADDWIYPECLSQMVRVAEAHPEAGMVGAQCRREDRIVADQLDPRRECFPGREIGRKVLLEGCFLFGSPNMLLFRASLRGERRPFFAPDRLHEDTEACYEILMRHDFGFVHAPLTFTRRSNESETSARKVFDAEHRLDKLIIAKLFAAEFLEPAEAEACLGRAERAYYRDLAERRLSRLAPGFWEYQHRGLRSAGLTLRRGNYLRALAARASRLLLHPRELIRKAAHVVQPGGAS